MTPRIRLVRGVAVVGAAALALSACGGDSGGTASPEGGGSGEAQGGTQLYLVDGNLSNDLPDGFDEGVFSGVKGTSPGAQATTEFQGRLGEINPDLGGTFTYAAESYDAVVTSALAALVAGDDSGTAVASELVNVTGGGGEACTTFAECSELIAAGTTDIDYNGVSGPIEFNDVGDPTVANIGVYTYGEDNTYSTDEAVFQEAELQGEAPPAPQQAPVQPGDGTLTIGSVLPQTGSLAFLGPPEFAGIDLALQEINEAGGVLGQEVAYVAGDSGDTSQDIANPTVDRLLAANADVIVGAASSSVSLTIIDKITSAGAVMYSPANTAPDFSTYQDNGLYFRTAPTDSIQGRVLAETVLADGFTNPAILVLQDPYGEGLASFTQQALQENGVELALDPVFYDPNATNFDAAVGQVAAANPDAVILVGFEESAQVIQAMIAAGIGPQ